MTTLTKNIVAFQKGLVIPPNDGMDNRLAVSTLQSHLMYFKYLLSDEAFEQLSKSDLSFIVNLHNEVLNYLKVNTGGGKNFKPLYKNFPTEVMSLNDSELYRNAIKHYLSNGTWDPSLDVSYEKDIKFENVKYNIINSGNEDDFSKIFTNLVSINTSLSPQDMDVVKFFVTSNQKLVLPTVIPFKENLFTLVGLGVKGLPVRTVTDVLRICVFLSGGDVSLPKVPSKYKNITEGYGWRKTKKQVKNDERDSFKFKNFKRSERKYILELFENTNLDVREMYPKRERFLRLGEKIHPTEYTRLYPKTAKAFDTLRNDKIVSFNRMIEISMDKSLEEGLKLLSQRPGEFARRLDYLIRTNLKHTDLIMSYFGKSCEKVSNKVLFEMYEHFEKRMTNDTKRSIMVKGSRKRTQLPTLPKLSSTVVENIHQQLFITLKEKFSKLDSLGNCWIDERLKLIPLPSNMRSLNFSLKPMIRGQRTPFENPNAKVIRGFVHWVDNYGNEDLDLSATFVTHNGQASTVSFNNLRSEFSVHSGDVRHRKGDCAEYIDVDVLKIKKSNIRYMIFDVRNYEDRGLNTLESHFGFMEREFPESNKTWLPETLVNCLKLESKSSNTMATMFDFETMEYIFLDIDSDGSVVASSDTKNILKTIEEFSKPPKVSVYDLVKMHVESRGKQVDLDNIVDTYFKYEDFVQSYEKTGELMGV